MFCSTVSAEGVESANIVGYQQITIQPGYSLFTVTFENVNGEDYDIQDIKVLNANGSDYASNNKVRMQKVSPSGSYGTLYNYRLSKGGWCQAATFAGEKTVTFASGEGVALYNGDTAALLLSVSGGVKLNPVSTAIPAGSYQIIGNMTPVTVDLQDVIPYIGDVVCSANNKVRVQKVTSSGSYDTLYNYRQSKGGWCRSATVIGRNEVTLAPGEAVAVYNGETSAITLKFPSPISK